MPLGLRIVALVLFTGFAIPVSIVAIVTFWPAGMALAALLGWLWIQLASGSDARDAAAAPDRPAMPAPTGNRSFDGYRADLLDRLDAERSEFDEFLDRLRSAKDQTEFDSYMNTRPS